MSEGNKSNLADVDLWIRLVYMVIFALLSVLARFAICVVAGIQFLFALLAGAPNSNLRAFGDSLAQWTSQTYRFLCFACEQKPYPFQDWPIPAVETEASEDPVPAEEGSGDAKAEAPVVEEAQIEAKADAKTDLPEQPESGEEADKPKEG